jgi:hypothetical protein
MEQSIISPLHEVKAVPVVETPSSSFEMPGTSSEGARDAGGDAVGQINVIEITQIDIPADLRRPAELEITTLSPLHTEVTNGDITVDITPPVRCSYCYKESDCTFVCSTCRVQSYCSSTCCTRASNLHKLLECGQRPSSNPYTDIGPRPLDIMRQASYALEMTHVIPVLLRVPSLIRAASVALKQTPTTHEQACRNFDSRKIHFYCQICLAHESLEEKGYRIDPCGHVFCKEVS